MLRVLRTFGFGERDEEHGARRRGVGVGTPSEGGDALSTSFSSTTLALPFSPHSPPSAPSRQRCCCRLVVVMQWCCGYDTPPRPPRFPSPSSRGPALSPRTGGLRMRPWGATGPPRVKAPPTIPPTGVAAVAVRYGPRILQKPKPILSPQAVLDGGDRQGPSPEASPCRVAPRRGGGGATAFLPLFPPPGGGRPLPSPPSPAPSLFLITATRLTYL